ncbi:MAG: universal stress protein [Deltaproteobacteria bacterium]|nr:MAG: universal stress protein [Deltaproteobacteria bacterium]
MGSHKMKFLLAVDGSKQSFEAVRYVSQALRSKRVEVVLFHVMTKIPESFWDIEKSPTFRHTSAPVVAWASQQERVIEEFMERSRQLFVDRIIPEERVTVKIQEREVGVARDIVREAQNGYDAVVVGRWGMSKLKDLVWGSIANKLVGHLDHVPLWVVGGTPHTDKLLVAIDNSAEAMRVVDYVGAMLAGTKRRIELFHVLRDSGLLSAGDEDDFIYSDEIAKFGDVKDDFERAEEAIQEVFTEAFGRLEKLGFSRDQVTTTIVTGASSRAKAIVEEAKAGGYGTIVVGRRGLSRVEEFFMGRVSNKVIQLAKEMAVWVVSY